MNASRIRSIVLALVFGGALACDQSVTFLGESDGGGDGGGATDTYWPVPLDAGGDEATWRDSAAPWTPDPVPYCEAQFYPMPFDLWSDASGIYVLFGWQDTRPDPSGSGAWMIDEYPELSISYNGGLGWTEFYRGSCDDISRGACVSDLGGLLEGRVLGWGSYTPVYGFEPGMAERMWEELSNIGSLFVVNDHLAYAMWQAGPDSRVVRYDGTTWSPVPVALPFEMAEYGRIWADENDVFVAGGSAVLLSLDGDEWRIHDPGTVVDLASIWGFGGDDVWVGAYDGALLHYDGTAWSNVPWPSLDDGSLCNEEHAIHGMWGADGILYFITETQFARWDGTRVEVLAHWPRTYDDTPGAFACAGALWPVALWGNSPTEVFLAVARPAEDGRGGAYCDGIAVLWWDGAVLRQI